MSKQSSLFFTVSSANYAVALAIASRFKNYIWIRVDSLCIPRRASQVVLVVKNPPANIGDIRDAGSFPGSGRSPGGEHGNLLQYSCLENPMDRGAWWLTLLGITKIRPNWSNLASKQVIPRNLGKQKLWEHRSVEWEEIIPNASSFREANWTLDSGGTPRVQVPVFRARSQGYG